MKKRKHNFSEYMDNSKKLFKMLFGEDLYNQLKNTPLKSIEWDGLDIKCYEIEATFPNIKERFNESWIEYFKERDGSLLDLFIQSVFHYGYQQKFDLVEKKEREKNDLLGISDKELLKVYFETKNKKNKNDLSNHTK